MRTSQPLDFSSSKSPRDPGTRSMSPNEQKMTSGRAAMAWARSIVSRAVTHTGQPGPCSRSTSGGRSWSRPYFTIVCVWPPHTSMIVQGRVTVAATAAARRLAFSLSRYSSTYFIMGRLELVQLVHFLQEHEDL